jgi:hypothetical protein
MTVEKKNPSIALLQLAELRRPGIDLDSRHCRQEEEEEEITRRYYRSRSMS